MKVPLEKEEGKQGNLTLLGRLFGFFNNELKPEVEKFISEGKEYLEGLKVEEKGKELVEKTKT